MPSSINTNVAAYFAQANIAKAQESVATSVARLSSGNRIIKASDDVAGLSIGTSLRTQVTTLRQAFINTTQGNSLLQVADGALSQVLDILQRQKAIATNALSGTLSDTERSFLNQEFVQLRDEIDRLTSSTNFNGVTLLDGSVFGEKPIDTADTRGTQASASFSILTQQNSKKLVFNGVTFTGTAIVTSATQYLNGATITAELDNLAAALNASTDTRVALASYARVGNSLVITAKTGGILGQNYTFEAGAIGSDYGAANVAVTAGAAGTASRYNLQGGLNNGLGFGRTIASGVVGDNLALTQSQSKAQNTLNYSNSTIANFAAGKTVTFAGAAQTFTFTNAVAAVGDILIGTTVEETLDNAVAVLSNYKNLTTTNATNAFVFNQLDFTRIGKTIVIEKQDSGLGNLVTDANAAVTVVTNVANAFPTAAANFNNATFTGVTTTGVANSAFVGTISGFTGTYNGVSNRADFAITVGGIEYKSLSVNTAVTANTTVRFNSLTGGYFDVDFAANTGTTVTSQAGADTVAARLDAVFSGLTLYQRQNITSYSGAGDILTNNTISGSLTGTTLEIQLKDFTEVKIEDIKVSAPANGNTNGIIEFTVNGKTFRSDSTVTDRLGRLGVYKFVNVEDNNEFIRLNTGNNQTTFFRNSEEASSLENALKDALGFNEGGVTLKFQIGTDSADALEVSIGDASTESLYDGQSIDVLTQANAQIAGTVIDEAIKTLTSIRADVGALQSRFNYASANLQSSIQNQDSARGVLLDTDVATESTAYATYQVQLQAGISVLAQANLLQQNLLKLIG